MEHTLILYQQNAENESRASNKQPTVTTKNGTIMDTQVCIVSLTMIAIAVITLLSTIFISWG